MFLYVHSVTSVHLEHCSCHCLGQYASNTTGKRFQNQNRGFNVQHLPTVSYRNALRVKFSLYTGVAESWPQAIKLRQPLPVDKGHNAAGPYSPHIRQGLFPAVYPGGGQRVMARLTFACTRLSSRIAAAHCTWHDVGSTARAAAHGTSGVACGAAAKRAGTGSRVNKRSRSAE